VGNKGVNPKIEEQRKDLAKDRNNRNGKFEFGGFLGMLP